MICLKCKSENQFGNFCNECGNQLKEKCPECGKMEPIGRKVCETKLEEARNKQWEFAKPRIRNLPDGGAYSPITMISGIIIAISISSGVLCIPLVILLSSESIIWAISAGIFGILMLIISFLTWFFANKYFVKNIKKMELDKQKAKQKFLQENPDYAEILRKAEEE